MNQEQLMEIQEMSWTIANLQAQPGFKRKPSPVRKESRMFSLTLDTFYYGLPPDLDININAFRYFYKYIYDWSDVMTVILYALNDFEQIGTFSDVENFIVDDLKQFFNTFRGWGLVQNLLPREKRNMFLLAMQLRGLQGLGQGQISEEDCWKYVRNMFEQQPDLVEGDFDYSRMIPDFEVSISEEEFEGNDPGRNKIIELVLHKKGGIRYTLEVMFIVSKKRSELSLVNVAAEALATMVEYEHDIKDLVVSGEIPRTLSEPIRTKFIDLKWIRGDANTLNEVQNLTFDMDDEEWYDQNSQDLENVTGEDVEDLTSEDLDGYETAEEGDSDEEWETADEDE